MELMTGYQSAYHSILMVGPPKSGKSTLSVNLFGKDKTLVIGYDIKGLKSLGKVDILPIDPTKPWADSLDALSWIRREAKRIKKECIVLNDATHMSRMLLYAEKEGKDNRKRYALAIDKLRQFMLKLTTEFNDFHIIVESVDQVVRDDEDKVSYTAPNVIGKDTFAMELPGMFDHVFYVELPNSKTEIVNGKPVTTVTRTILTQSTKGKLAGNRINVAGQPRILDISEPVLITDNDFSNVDKLRHKLLGDTATPTATMG